GWLRPAFSRASTCSPRRARVRGCRPTIRCRTSPRKWRGSSSATAIMSAAPCGRNIEAVMRFLMIAMQYPVGAGQSYLTTELADALVAAGHDVEVLHLDWSAPPGSRVEEFRTATGVRVVRCGPKMLWGPGWLVRDASKF